MRNSIRFIGVGLVVIIAGYTVAASLFSLFFTPLEQQLRLDKQKTVMIEVKTIADVMILSFDDKGYHITQATYSVTYLGAGVSVGDRGQILTCAHLFESVYPSTVSVINSSGHKAKADVLNVNTDKDLALIISPIKLPKAVMSSKRSLFVGQSVYAIGNPFGLDFSVTHGMISALNRKLEGILVNFIQTDTPINPGNSGGPLFDEDGSLVGINARGAREADGLGFAIDVDELGAYLNQFGLN